MFLNRLESGQFEDKIGTNQLIINYLFGRAPCFAASPHSPLHPQLMLWFTYYKGTFSTFVFASQNRVFMLRSVLRTLRPSMRLTQKLAPQGKPHGVMSAVETLHTSVQRLHAQGLRKISIK